MDAVTEAGAVFNPRLAALAHAGEAERFGHVGAPDEITAAAANAVACGLVYVGDQIKALGKGDAKPTLDQREILAVADSLEEMGDDLRAARLRAAVGGDVVDAEVIDDRTERERVEEVEGMAEALAELAAVAYGSDTYAWARPSTLIREAARRLRAVS